MMKNKIIGALAITTILASSSVLAEALKLPAGSSGQFNCTVDSHKPFLKINIDTDSVEVKGFCAGQPNVTSPGHVAGLSKSDINDYYFEYKTEALKTGTITIDASSDVPIHCTIGPGEKRKSYGNGKYC